MSILSASINRRKDCNAYNYYDVNKWVELYLSGYRVQDIAKEYSETTTRVRAGIQRHSYGFLYKGLARMNRVQQMAGLELIKFEDYDTN